MSICFKIKDRYYDCDCWCDYEQYSSCTDHRVHMTSCDNDELTLGLVPTDYNQAVDIPFRVTLADTTYKPLTRDCCKYGVFHSGGSQWYEKICCTGYKENEGYCYCMWNETNLGCAYSDVPGTFCYRSYIQCCPAADYGCSDKYWVGCSCHVDAFQQINLNCLVQLRCVCSNFRCNKWCHGAYFTSMPRNATAVCFTPDDTSLGSTVVFGQGQADLYNYNITCCLEWEILHNHNDYYAMTLQMPFTDICYTV